jgi:hypothetical protein
MLWLNSNVHVMGAPRHVFIKVSTHGAQERNMAFLFSSGFETLWSSLERLARNGAGYRLHYVTAFEMFRKVKEIEGAASQPTLESTVEAQRG